MKKPGRREAFRLRRVWVSWFYQMSQPPSLLPSASMMFMAEASPPKPMPRLSERTDCAIMSQASTCTVSTNSGGLMETGPLTRVTRAPLLAAALATA